MLLRSRRGVLRRTSFVIVCICLFLFVSVSAGQVVKIADEEQEILETAHPYVGGDPAGRVVWSKTLHWPEASYIAVHFERFELAPGDTLVLQDPAGRYRHTYQGRGFMDRGGQFWGLSILGDTMELQLISMTQANEDFGLLIDRWAHGFPLEDPLPETDALCGSEDFRDIECYKDSYPDEYQVGRAAVRLIKNGSAHCTGWIASCENHILTNEHCVGSQSELDTIEFQFEYKRSGCGSGETTVDLQLQGGTLLEVKPNLDYAMVMPELAGHDPQSVYGFMQWETRLPDIDEFMFIPGHPSGDPKRLSIDSTDSHDESGRCEVFSTDQPACTSGAPVPDIGYYCDTEGGSSGSAVLSSETLKVIALHHCANCPNRGVPILDVYNSIQGSAHPLPACVTCQPAGTPADLVTSSPADNQVLLDWEPVADAELYHVYRNDTDCDDAMVEIGSSATASYLDEEVAGEITYYYRVSAASACGAESNRSNCSVETPSGLCTEPPRFDGLGSVTNDRAGSCGISLDWEPGTARCGAIHYNVYRSTFSDFEPSAGNLVATCLDQTSFHDLEVLPLTDYYYVVRAEDGTANGIGPCNGGNEDANHVSLNTKASGPDDVFYSEGFETGLAGWIISDEFQFGVPQGKGGAAAGGAGNPDPVGPFSGIHSMGHDISGQGSFEGNYENNLGENQAGATSPAFNTAGHDEVHLRFARWLGTLAAPGDQALVEVFNGSGWSVVWSNPESNLFDDAWVVMDLDISEAAGGSTDTRVRFSQKSNSNGVACGWNVDALEVFSPTTCSSSVAAPAPVPDGRNAPGRAMEAVRSGADVQVSWDASTCTSPEYHLFHGDSNDLPVYGYAGAACDLGDSGDATVAIPDPMPGHFTWWTIAGAEGVTDGIHGYTSGGGIRPADGIGLCGLSEHSTAGTCP